MLLPNLWAFPARAVVSADRHLQSEHLVNFWTKVKTNSISWVLQDVEGRVNLYLTSSLKVILKVRAAQRSKLLLLSTVSIRSLLWILLWLVLVTSSLSKDNNWSNSSNFRIRLEYWLLLVPKIVTVKLEFWNSQQVLKLMLVNQVTVLSN
jgi:hypothetical protein